MKLHRYNRMNGSRFAVWGIVLLAAVWGLRGAVRADGIRNSASMDEAELTIGVCVDVDSDGQMHQETDTTIIIVPEKAENPMPDDRDDGRSVLKIRGGGQGQFDPIRYRKCGVYGYLVYQQAGRQEGFVYDDAVYSLKVYVTDELGDGLHAMPVYYEPAKRAVSEQIRFQNSRIPLAEAEPSPQLPDWVKWSTGTWCAMAVMAVLFGRKMNKFT